MPATYSILHGQLTESTRKIDINSILQELSNNSQKLISPRDLRDAFLTTWANATFKLTSVGNNEYIGIDSNNPLDRDIKKKILIGKRSFGTFNVMSDSLINTSDSDIFIYNTKPDNVSQDSTKISILAGTFSNLFNNAPFIESIKNTSVLDFNLINPQGSVNILSTDDVVSINNLSFPTVFENQNLATDGMILKYVGIYPSGKLTWQTPTTNYTQIGGTDSVTNIEGDGVYLNGSSLEFIEDRLVPTKIGGIAQGMSFSVGSNGGSNWSLSSVMRELIYPYIEPVLDLSINTKRASSLTKSGINGQKNNIEVGSGNGLVPFLSPYILTFSYSVTTFAREQTESISSYHIRNNGIQNIGTWDVISSGGQLLGSPGQVFTFSLTSSYIGTTSSIVDFGFMASTLQTTLDPNTSTFGYSFSVIDSIHQVSPFLWGFDYIKHVDIIYTNITNSNGIKDIISSMSMTRDTVRNLGTVSCSLNSSTSKYIYFSYPSSFGNLSTIMDPNGFVIHDINDLASSSFIYITGTASSPLSYYGSYNVYRSKLRTTYNGSSIFKFIF